MVLLAAACGVAWAASPPAAPVLPGAKQNRARIDALFGKRNGKPLALEPQDNPFRPAGRPASPSAGSPGAADAPAPPATDAEALNRAAAAVRITGTGSDTAGAWVSIEQTTYRVGSTVVVRIAGGSPVFLTVHEIVQRPGMNSEGSVTFRLNDLTISVPYGSRPSLPGGSN